ncbi:MAG: ABC-F family ATP-binding cassette domain-containing protein [Bacteroides sp.]|nr:ABC-F family ATP-binding cassette domain-containing protein [Bacteroides sp.]MCM1085041.1 ABC-F family ATP-binding cassette domain-containing protein [Bacteroides sp.]
MNYLSVENVSKTYGEKRLFADLTFGLEKGEKAALVARNGAGKTTLLNIICGKVLPDAGQVVTRNGIRMDYLPQTPQFDPQQSVMDFVFSGRIPALQAAREYEQLLWDMEKQGDTPQLQAALEEATVKMERLQAWDYEEKVKEVLYRLQLPKTEQKMGELSGGQQKKAALARVLVEGADLLLMDEPTNHLDMEMTEWLEDFLRRQNLALLLVTHDRTFLDNVCSKILEIDNAKIYTYKGNYAYFLEKKAERESIERSEIEKAKNLYRRELEWMRRMPSARGTKARARVDAFGQVREKAMQRIDDQVPELSVESRRLGNKILEVSNLCKSFDGTPLVDDFSYTFKKGEKIGIVGRNGIGKSTLLNMLTGNLKPDRGHIQVGQTVQFGYYTQGGLPQKEDKRVIDIVKEVAEVVKMQDGREISASQFLNYFQFEPSTQYNYFSNLSGGERRRLYLLRTLMENPNFLILDEPTNDLDVYTLMLLEDFLSHYQGCLLMVSHDRSFLDHIADHIFVFEGEGKIKDWYGTYGEYRKQKAEKEKEARQEGKKERRQAAPNDRPATQKPKATFKQKKEYGEICTRMAALEDEKQRLESVFSGAETDADKITEASRRIAEILPELSALEDRWLELSEIVEAD